MPEAKDYEDGLKSVSTNITPEEVEKRIALIKEMAAKHPQSASKKGKLRWSLLPVSGLEEVVKVLEFGAQKHSLNGWREDGGMSWTEFIDAADRHIADFKRGKDLDDETKLIQAAHIACNWLFIAEYQLKKLGKDDRYIYPEAK